MDLLTYLLTYLFSGVCLFVSQFVSLFVCPHDNFGTIHRRMMTLGG